MTERLTNPVFISWYISVMFILGLLIGSAVTVGPEGEFFVKVMMAVCLVATFSFAVLALWLQRRARLGLDFGPFISQPLRIGYAVLALIITMALLAVGGG